MSHVDDGILHSYLDGELSPADAREVEAHLPQCPDCRRRLEEERALIARAAELLAVATPPDHALPPFRAGDVRAPTRVWWQVRLPLAWAATVTLALGIGTYLGREVQRAPDADAARDTPAAAATTRAEPPKQELVRRETRGTAPGAARTPPAAPVGPPQAHARADNIASAPAAGVADADERSQWQKGGAISVDSARRVLGADPLVVPGVPIEALYRGRAIGYADAVIVEQALDASTMIEVINARSAPQLLDQVVVAGAPVARPEPARAPDALRAAKAAGRLNPDLFRDVRGPLSADSLAALRRRLQPLRAATGP